MSGENGQLPLFDYTKARDARDAGIARVVDNKADWLEEVRQWALAYCDSHGTVTADDVRRVYATPAGYHYNVWGGIFTDRRFKWTGRFAHSANVAGHANTIRVWMRRR